MISKMNANQRFYARQCEAARLDILECASRDNALAEVRQSIAAQYEREHQQQLREEAAQMNSGCLYWMSK